MVSILDKLLKLKSGKRLFLSCLSHKEFIGRMYEYADHIFPVPKDIVSRTAYYHAGFPFCKFLYDCRLIIEKICLRSKFR